MKGSQNTKKTIKDITSIRQMLGSYLVAESIIEIREERRHELEDLAEKQIPQLNVDNEIMQKIYHDFAALMNFNYTYVCLAKIGLEDMVKYNFYDNPSVMITASGDTSHLSDKFGPSFTTLKNTSLLQHSLNVFQNAIDIGRAKGRVMQIATPILGALFHDFGKSEQLRNELIGEERTPSAYKSHASVSGIYIQEKLSRSFYELTNETPSTMLESLFFCVANHHPKDKRQLSDIGISLIKNADMKAREVEFKENKFKNKKQ